MAGSRANHTFVIDFILSGKTPGELLAQKDVERAKLVVDFIHNGPSRDLALTDPNLYARLQAAIIRLRIKGWG